MAHANDRRPVSASITSPRSRMELLSSLLRCRVNAPILLEAWQSCLIIRGRRLILLPSNSTNMTARKPFLKFILTLSLKWIVSNEDSLWTSIFLPMSRASENDETLTLQEPTVYRRYQVCEANCRGQVKPTCPGNRLPSNRAANRWSSSNINSILATQKAPELNSRLSGETHWAGARLTAP